MLIKLEFSSQIFPGNPNIRFHENPPVGPEFHVDGWIDGRKGQTDMTKLITFQNFAKAPRKETGTYRRHKTDIHSYTALTR